MGWIDLAWQSSSVGANEPSGSRSALFYIVMQQAA
jgi:hypothetical protein